VKFLHGSAAVMTDKYYMLSIATTGVFLWEGIIRG